MQALHLMRSLFAYKAWANEDLYDSVARLPAETRAAELHAALRVLNHIHVVDSIFAAHLQGQAHGYAGLNTPETPGPAELRARVQASDRWYLGYLDTLSDMALGEVLDFSFVDGKPGRMSRAEMLLHVATHGNYHRGAVGRILVQAEVAPPPDALTVFLHRPATRA